MTDWTLKTAAELKVAYARGETTALEVTEQYIQRIKASHHNAFLHMLFDRARSKARDLDLRRRGAELGPLAGIPVAVKDILATTFAPTTCASKILEGYISPYDATVIHRLERADAIILGKTNMDEFAMGSSNENSAYGPVHNPHAHGYAPGGSSGGAAAAVAGYLSCMALGSDTGGSVRQPAAFCGCVGFKPTYGAVSRYGLVAFASSLDQVGPMGRSVGDVAALYDVIAGPDERDSTATTRELPRAVDALAERRSPLRIGVMREASGAGVADEVNETIERIVELCQQAGHRITIVSLPTLPLGIATYYVIADAEASANLARYDGVKYGRRAHGPNELYALYARTRGEGFGAEVKRRIMLGTYVLSAGYYDAYYLTALKVRNKVRADFARAFGEVDFLFSPTTPTAAFRLGEKVDDPLAMYLSDVFTVPANLAGIPAVSIPAGKTDDGLPLGIQLWGPRWSDDRLLRAAAQIEELVAYNPH